MGRLVSLFLLSAVVSSPLFAAFDSAEFNKAEGRPLELQRITPNGEDVPAGRQLVFQFNRPVVPVGRMERRAEEIPIAISPALQCEWRWLNTSALACQLGEKQALRPATRYQVTVSPGITTEDGVTLTEAVVHTFTTLRPKLTRTGFYTWRSPGWPVLQLYFNLPVEKSSVQQAISLVTADGEKRQLRFYPAPEDNRRHQLLLRKPGEVGLSTERGEDNTTAAQQNASTVKRLWYAEPLQELPLQSEVRLNVAAGLRTPEGPETGLEQGQRLSFHTFPEFRFIGVRCQNLDERWQTLSPQEDPSQLNRCNPLAGVALAFSAPVASEMVKEHMQITPDLAGGRTDYDPWANRYGRYVLNSPHRPGHEYYVWFPELLKTWQGYEVISDDKFTDAFGRQLPEPLFFAFSTDHRKPDMQLNHRYSVLEKETDTEVPVVVTNIDRVDVSYDRLTTTGGESSLSQSFSLPEVEDIAYLHPLGVRDMLQGESGAVYGSLASDPQSGRYRDYSFFAEVTPFSVHVKAGHYNTLIWVTDMATGEPVEGARVQVYLGSYGGLETIPETLATVNTDINGVAMLPGSEKLDPELKYLNRYSYRDAQPVLMVRVDKGNDMALLPLDRNFSISSGRVSRWAVSERPRKKFGHLVAWGFTAQGVYKAGDTIQYKFYVRNRENERLAPAPAETYKLVIIDPKGNEVEKREQVTLSAFGAVSGEFTVPENGAVGWYRFRLEAPFAKLNLQPLTVLVSDFTPVPFKVSTELNGARFLPGDRISITSQARMHSGGAYTNAENRVTLNLSPRPLSPEASVARGFHFNTGGGNSQSLFQQQISLGEKGESAVQLDVPDSSILYGRLTAESAVRDDRGKFAAGYATAFYAARDRFVGLRRTSWLMKEDEEASVDTLVVDADGKPVAGASVEVRVMRQETKAARVKGAGNAYITQYSSSWVDVAKCSLVSTREAVPCKFSPEQPGDYRITASVKDTKGRDHQTILTGWVAGKGRVVWTERPDNSLEILPEKQSFRVGEKARYVIKNPFPGAMALISIERYGVIKQWTQRLDGPTPLIEFPIEESFIPGYYLSVIVMSPRVEPSPGPTDVDLGKPAFRIGYQKAEVRDGTRELKVTARADKETYRPRDKVKVKLHVERGPQPVELAVAVVDEGVFDLLKAGRGYYDPYQGLYALDGLDVSNFNLLLRLVGRQKFEKKGANPGGDGGADFDVRSVFKYLSYWNPSLTPDANGDATIEFDAPDNLTGWRILAVAVEPGERVGLGESSFQVNRPTEVRPVMPNQVLEGDSFKAGFNIMNRTASPRTLKVVLKVEGPVDGGAITSEQTLKLKPWQRATVWMPVETRNDGTLRFTVRAWDDIDRDGIVHDLKVLQMASPLTAATYGTTTQVQVQERVKFPADILPNVGGLSVTLAPSVIGNVEGAFSYLRDYPYSCWEQKLTKGVMADHYQNLKAYIPDRFSWEGSAALPDATLAQAARFQAPNGGMTYFVARDDYVSPYLSAYTALTFNWLRDSGHDIPQTVEERLQGYLERMLRRDVLPSFYSAGMASTVRAVALAALAERGKVARNDLVRYRSHLGDMSLFGRAHYLLAAMQVEGTEDLRREATRQILAHSNASGGKFIFSEQLDDGYSRLLDSSLRTNCAILSALTQMGETQEGASMVGDIPFKLVRYITQSRGQRDYWENTQENMFCMNALVDFSRVYEKETPKMTLRANLGNEAIGKAEFDDLRNPPVTLERPMQASDPGSDGSVTIGKDGTGRLYYAVRLAYAPKELMRDPVNAGIEIHREYSVERETGWVLLQDPMRIRRGELVRVDLYVSLPTARNFVVVNDPVPGGLEPVNRDLATASTVDADKGAFKAAGGSWWFRQGDWNSFGLSRWNFYHQELRHDAVRFYSDYLPAGNYHLSYTAQAVATGQFTVMPSLSEEMYDPDIFGKSGAAMLQVTEE